MEWVNTATVGGLLVKHWRSDWSKLAEQSGVNIRQIRRIANVETQFTKFDIADTLLTTIGLNSTIELDPFIRGGPSQLKPDDPRHGTRNGYVNYHCRCPRCTRAHTLEMRKRRKRRGLT